MGDSYTVHMAYLRLLEQLQGLEFFGHPFVFLAAGAHVTEVELQQGVVHNIRQLGMNLNTQ